MKTKIIIMVECAVLILTLYFVFLSKNSTNRINSIPLPTFKNTKSDIKYSAWIPYWKQKEAVESIESMKQNKLSEVMPVWYELDSKGLVVESKYIDKQRLLDLTSDKKIKVTPTLTNATSEGFDSLRVSMFIEEGDKSVVNLVDIAKENKYSGWDLDLEEIKEEDKGKYVEFVEKLSKKLHSNKLTLSITVHAQSGNEDWSGTRGQDIKSLSKYADKIRVMIYDFHNVNSDPGPVTPTQNLKNTIEYTLQNTAKEKIVVCLPTYGYDWSKKINTPLQFDEMKSLVFKESVNVSRDEESFEMTGEYFKDGDLHTIWYQDNESLLKKIEVSKTYGITNFCFWNLGGEDKELWDNI